MQGTNNSSGDYANFWIIFKVAQTRLENRTYRPNVELCRDAAQYQLCHEVREIEGTVKALVEKLQEAQNAHNSLNDNLRNIEEDLAIKVIMTSHFFRTFSVYKVQWQVDDGKLHDGTFVTILYKFSSCR